MDLKRKLTTIANYLTTERRSKKHGGYNVYKDDKIEISYDTYYPNVDVRVTIDGVSKLAVLYSGHGHTQEFHGGAWVRYVEEVLYPKAVEAKAIYEENQKRRETEEYATRNARLNDSAVFAR